MSANKTFQLNTGQLLPAVGFGTWMGWPPTGTDGGTTAEENYHAVLAALRAGYRHIDTAAVYRVEEAVGRALKDSGIPRSEIFVTTKLDCPDHGRVADALGESLKRLDLDYVDLYLIHWPQGAGAAKDVTPLETWLQMEKLVGIEKVKAIGVSNFSEKTFASLLEKGSIVPAVNQVEVHPYLPSIQLREFHDKHGIHTMAYSPLGGQLQTQLLGNKNTLLADEVISEIAKSHLVTPGQVLLAWNVLNGSSVIPKSANPERMKANLELPALGKEEMKRIDELHRSEGKHQRLATPPQGLHGWSYQDLGWDVHRGPDRHSRMRRGSDSQLRRMSFYVRSRSCFGMSGIGEARNTPIPICLIAIPEASRSCARGVGTYRDLLRL
ncbi:aado/keto reductase [Planoprotostelium fungivorum]|uniref:Aado/keto reductase n=1 Tax=Planoprotostelium fungivorum TaxID=1890364 RepID=A0A2P6NGX4_9EUKA|nr:aado/keto reductase [Planoprotostelium fungivorum]